MDDADRVIGRLESAIDETRRDVDDAFEQIDKLKGAAYGAKARIDALLDNNGSSDFNRRVREILADHERERGIALREVVTVLLAVLALVVSALPYLRGAQ